MSWIPIEMLTLHVVQMQRATCHATVGDCGRRKEERPAAACLAMDLSPIQSALSSKSYSTLADTCDELMLQARSFPASSGFP
ncbi:hypothetical protein Cni_G06047 [Canna indica]|uniref:Uncharacterized protein n=1 Tax=Canna indica TaxID=4628 RepID=A0AAQ3JVT4_9LILI|nr:hypothetical protein Cni_G06047 [Canna indica]